MRQFYKLDAAESAFFARQLEAVKARTYDIRYPELKSRMFIPVSNEVNAGAETVTYRQFDRRGQAKIISNNAKDIPRVDVLGTEFTRPVREPGAAYGWTLKEIRAAAMAGLDLNTKKASAARRAIEEMIDEVAAIGAANYGIATGMINSAAVPTQNVPNGAGGNEEWDTKTPDEIIADVSAAHNRISVATLGIHMPNTLLLPTEAYSVIATTRLTDSSVTVLDFLKKSFTNLTMIEPWYRLNTAGAAGGGRMIVYQRSPEVLEQDIPNEFEQLPVQEQGFEFVVNCWASTAGTALYYPLAMDYSDRVS